MIGMFDSGIGGLSVFRALRTLAPHVYVVYFGDTENAPYGEKSSREIATLVSMALRRLHAQGATNIINACNSASVSALSELIDLLRLNVFDVVEMVGPTVSTLAPLQKKIVLFGTPATIQAGLYQRAFEELGITIDTVAIPPLADLIEKGASAEEIRPVVERAVKEAVERGAEIISFSCTHYPFVKNLFEDALQKEKSAAVLFDPAEAVAQEAARRFGMEGNGTLRFLVSKESPIFESHVERLFGSAPYSIDPAGPIYWALKTI